MARNGESSCITADEAQDLIRSDERNRDVIFRIINGQELNNDPRQEAAKHIIFFFDRTREAAAVYTGPFLIVEQRVRPFRETQNRAGNRDNWWRYGEHRPSLTKKLRVLRTCFVTAQTAKHLCFSELGSDILPSQALRIFTTDRWDLFVVVQSTLHEVWARKYSGSLKQDLRYSPSKCFDTFAFPAGLWQTTDPGLAELGERYHAHRKDLMQSLWLGLTKIYNLFHTRDLSREMVAKVSKKDADTAAAGYESLLELRRLHVEMDLAVRDTYGWDLDLEHDFHEVEYRAENDRVRYTISPAARREVLKRLLAENHARAEVEDANPPLKPKRGRQKSTAVGSGTPSLFTRSS